MDATGIGVGFVVLASLGLVLTLVATLIWLVAVIVKGFARGWGKPTRPTRR